MIYSVIILYNPENDICDNILKLITASGKVVLVNNSTNSLPQNIEDLREHLNVFFIENGRNLGLSKALNAGIKFCIEMDDCKYIALFDQDSKITGDFFPEMINGFKINDSIVAVGCTYVDIKEKKTDNTKQDIFLDIIITSGSLYKKDSFDKVGLMDESLFIDYIDYEWGFRAKSKGYKILKVSSAKMVHNMGEQTIKFLSFSKPYHTNKIRHYYIFRNQILMLRRNYVPFKWKIYQIIKFFYRIPIYVLLSKSPLDTIKIITKGVVDGLKYKAIDY